MIPLLPARANLARLFMWSTEAGFAIWSGINGVRSRFPDPPEGETHAGAGRLTVRRGWRFLNLAGTPREMGLQHGQLLKPVIPVMLDAYFRGLRQWRGLRREKLLRHALEMEPYIAPACVEEMHAVAQGAGVRYEDVLIAHTFLEKLQAIACSGYAAHGSATSGGRLIFGRNLEFFTMGVAHRCNVIGFFKPQGGIPFLSIGWPGICGTATAVNLEGLCLGLLNVNRVKRASYGEPYLVTMRRIAQEARTCDDAVRILENTRRAFSNNILVAQTRPERRTVVIEYDPDRVVVREPKPGNDWIASTNHFRKFGRQAEWPDHRGFARYPALTKLMEEHRGRISLATDILADPRVHLPNSIHALIADPERRRVRIAFGQIPAAKGPYRTFAYDENGISNLKSQIRNLESEI